MTHSFPKIIWQTHNYKKEDLPEHISAAGATWKNINPDWDYRYIDHYERDKMVSKYPKIYETYKTQGPTFQSDVWRFLVTYEYGGCYADMDSVCIKPLNYLLQDIGSNIELVTVPEAYGTGNTHNYVTKQKSQPMVKVFNEMISAANTLIEWETWKIFVRNVYSDDTISKTFIVQTPTNSKEDRAAEHIHDYKFSFDPSKHIVNDYGQIVNYMDFIKSKGFAVHLSSTP